MTYQVNLMRTLTNTLPINREEEEREGEGEREYMYIHVVHGPKGKFGQN